MGGARRSRFILIGAACAAALVFAWIVATPATLPSEDSNQRGTVGTEVHGASTTSGAVELRAVKRVRELSGGQESGGRDGQSFPSPGVPPTIPYRDTPIVGTVVDERGGPLVNVVVLVTHDASIESPRDGLRRSYVSQVLSTRESVFSSTRTDRQGRFQLSAVPLAPSRCRLDAELEGLTQRDFLPVDSIGDEVRVVMVRPGMLRFHASGVKSLARMRLRAVVTGSTGLTTEYSLSRPVSIDEVPSGDYTIEVFDSDSLVARLEQVFVPSGGCSSDSRLDGLGLTSCRVNVCDARPGGNARHRIAVAYRLGDRDWEHAFVRDGVKSLDVVRSASGPLDCLLQSTVDDYPLQLARRSSSKAASTVFQLRTRPTVTVGLQLAASSALPADAHVHRRLSIFELDASGARMPAVVDSIRVSTKHASNVRLPANARFRVSSKQGRNEVPDTLPVTWNHVTFSTTNENAPVSLQAEARAQSGD